MNHLFRILCFVVYLMAGFIVAPLVALIIYIKQIPDAWKNIVVRKKPVALTPDELKWVDKRPLSKEPPMPPIFYPKIGNS